MDKNYGTLYICATPIGNMGDITLRVLDTLKNVDYIAAEDTRHTLKLLNRYNIKNRLLSCHEHNETARATEFTALLKEGKNIALVTDAGTPVISDPGGIIISECVREGIHVTVCPGASASVAALALSGMDCGRFVFEGFLPGKAKERKSRIEALKSEMRAVVLYEAPHRLLKTLKELLECLGERDVAIIREMTKIHEEVLRTTISGALRVFEERAPKGEFVIVLAGAKNLTAGVGCGEESMGLTVKERVSRYVSEGLGEMEAIKKVSKDLGVSKRTIYGEVKCKT